MSSISARKIADSLEKLHRNDDLNETEFFSSEEILESIVDDIPDDANDELYRGFVASTNTIHKDPKRFLSSEYADIIRRKFGDGYKGWSFKLVSEGEIGSTYEESGFEGNSSHDANQRNLGLWNQITEQSSKLAELISDYEEFYSSSRHEPEEYKWEHVKRFQNEWPSVKEKTGLDFLEALEKAISDNKNLLYWRAKDHLETVFEENPERSSEAFKELLNEDKDVEDRIESFFDFFYRSQDENLNRRVVSFFLASLYPQKYVYYKHNEYRDFFNAYGLELEHGFSSNNRVKHYLEVNETAKEVLKNIEIEDKNLWHFQDLVWFHSNYRDKKDDEIFQEIKNEIDQIFDNAKQSYTRVFGIKVFLGLNKDEITSEELKQAVSSEYSETLPGKKSSYIRYREKAFKQDKYSIFEKNGNTLRLNPTYRKFRDKIKNYVEDKWEEVSTIRYFVVSHNDKPEQFEEGYLEASYTENSGGYDGRYLHTHDLNMLEKGDVVLHYIAQEFVGYSEVEKSPEIIERDGEKKFHLEVDINRFDEPRSISDFSNVLEDGRSEVDKYYAYTEDGTKAQGYLKLLTEKAAKSIINGKITINDAYYWVTANPSIWEASSLEENNTKFYPGYLPSGSKCRIFSNFQSASEGDKVVFYESTPVKQVVAVGEVSESLHKEETEGYDKPVEGITLQYKRKINGEITWSDLNEIPALEDSEPLRNTAQGSIFKLNENEYETILALEEPKVDGNSKLLKKYSNTPKFNVSIPDNLYFEEKINLKAEINASLNSGKNIIFTGPPGTGKTKLAKSIAVQVSNEHEQVEDSIFTTATADWTAFDTIGGYMPSNSDQLEFKPGQFLKCFRKDSGEVTNNWLVIDEINRSDIDKAFGQLFSVLSGDSVELPYERSQNIRIENMADVDEEQIEKVSENKDVYPVASSWRLIATMNTLDKASLYEMSYAFMRRFNQIHIGIPDLTNDEGILKHNILDDYFTKWGDIDEEKVNKEELALLWYKVSQYQEIGPSIIKDIATYLSNYEEENGLESAIVSLIYPQMEGLRPEKQKKFITSLNQEKDGISINISEGTLKSKAESFFGIKFED